MRVDCSATAGDSEPGIAASRYSSHGAGMARSSGYSGRSFSASVSSTSYARPIAHPSGHPSASHVLGTRPSLLDQRHHDVVPPEISSRIFRPAWLHRTRLLQLRDTDLIDEPQLDTACRWRADHDRAHASFGLTSGYLPKIDSAPPGALQAHRLDALRRLRETAAALGQWRTLLLERLVAFDDSWPALGKLLRCSHPTARLRLAEILVALCEHHNQAGRCRRRT